MFSKSQIQEIITKLQWWKRWKDSEFDTADKPLSGKETFVVVQKGKNKSFTVRNLKPETPASPDYGTPVSVPISVRPFSANLYVDGIRQHLSNNGTCTVEKKVGDIITISAEATGYVSDYRAATVSKDSSFNIILPSDVVDLHVEAVPAYSTVLLNGTTHAGNIVSVNRGAYVTVEVIAAGYRTQRGGVYKITKDTNLKIQLAAV